MAPTLSFLFVLAALLPPASTLSFNFPTFNSSTPQFFTFQNDSFFDKVIKLTRNELGSSIDYSVGRAVYNVPLQLYNTDTGQAADFTTHFSFVIDALNQSSFGDGLTFFLAELPSAVPPGSAGANLGLVDESTSPEASLGAGNRFVAVEFDTFKNGWDPSDDHIGIDVNSLVSVANVSWSTSLKDGRKANAWVSYNATTFNLSVFLTYDQNTTFTSGDSSLYHVVDLREVLPEKVAVGFSASTGLFAEIHNVLSWNFSSSLVSMEDMEKNKKGGGIGVGLSWGIGFFLLIVGSLWFILWLRRSRRAMAEKEEAEKYNEDIDDEFENGKGPKRFSYAELAGVTKNFAEELKLGEGGFGGVYRGLLKEPMEDVAIKRVSRDSKQGKKEFLAEVKIISRLRHQNLVQLVGYCHERGELMLVYEYMPNGSLDLHLYGSKNLLPWPLRYKIIKGLASALLYLHEEWEECVVHRDLKPSNVMLDAAYNAKLGDFGLARLVDHGHGMQTTVVAGTMGYLAPECLTSGKASKDSDVYAFGVVALELASGRRPVEPNERSERVGLVAWVWDLYGSDRALEAADPRLGSEFETEEMRRLLAVGLWCAHPDSSFRPSVRQIVAVLGMEAPLPQLPPRMPVPMYNCFPLPPPAQMGLSSASSASSGSTGGYTTTSESSSAPIRNPHSALSFSVGGRTLY